MSLDTSNSKPGEKKMDISVRIPADKVTATNMTGYYISQMVYFSTKLHNIKLLNKFSFNTNIVTR